MSRHFITLTPETPDITLDQADYVGDDIAFYMGHIRPEDLRAGDPVLTARSGIATVKWIGYRTFRKAFIPTKDAIRAFPITFVKDAIGPNLPYRELTLSPGHQSTDV